MLYMLDTDISSYIIKGCSANIEARLESVDPSSVCVSAITRAELFYGLKRLPAKSRVHVGVRQFLKTVRVLAWDSEAADFYGEIKHHLIRSGQRIGELDMMIAAHSLALAATLVTNNVRHYERIAAPLILQNWT